MNLLTYGEFNLAGAIIGHMVGDYILQNHWMANEKKRDSYVCSLHCLLWTSSVCFFAQAFSPLSFAFLFVTHFIQDRTSIVKWSMHRMGQTDFLLAPFWPWSLMTVDNTWHLVEIWIVWRLF